MVVLATINMPCGIHSNVLQASCTWLVCKIGK